MDYVQMTLSDWMELKQRLKRELLGVKQSFVRIGYALRQIEDQKLYEKDGYKSIADFAKAEYGLEASTVSRFMSINREYSIDGYSERLRPEYEDLSRSQLEEMLKLPDQDRKMIEPQTPREAIRDLKRFNKEGPESGTGDLRELVKAFYKDHLQILKELYAHPEDMTDNEKKAVEVVNPSGNRTYKKGLYFLIMYETRLVIKKFGHEPQEMSWKEFFALTMELFPEGKKTRMEYFGESDEEKEETMDPDETEKTEGKQENNQKEVSTEDTDKKRAAGTDRPDPKSGTHDQGRTPDAVKPDETIAPAQKSAETLEEKASEEPEKEQSKETKQEAFLNAPEEGEPKEDEKEIEVIYPTRKEYMDRLTAEELSVYIAREYKERSLKVATLAFPDFILKWLTASVDLEGRKVQEEYHE